jgi:hypothetical protein
MDRPGLVTAALLTRSPFHTHPPETEVHGNPGKDDLGLLAFTVIELEVHLYRIARGCPAFDEFLLFRMGS